MDKDVFDSVLIEAGGPRIRKVLEKDLESFSSCDSNSILGVIQSLEQLRINLFVVLILKDMSEILNHPLDQDN